MKIKILPVIACVALLSSCYYDNEEELYPGEIICDTSHVTYTLAIKPILDNRCITCHENNLTSGGHNLQHYDGVKDAVNSGRLLGAIRHEPGFTPMPQGASRLDDCDIKKIETWINNGMPE